MQYININLTTCNRKITLEREVIKMSKTNIDEKYLVIKADLENRKQTIVAGTGDIISNGLNKDNNIFPDLSDQASAETDQNFVLRIKEREQKLLKKITEALDRVNEGTYGICEDCGEEIGYKRLLARPVTTSCIECKTKQEEYENLRET